MKKIDLKDGKFMIVDDEDFEYLNQWKWKIVTGYAMRNVRVKNNYKKYRSVISHRLLINVPLGFEVDHINGDRLDNRKENLRVCTRSQNLQNQRTRSNNTSGYKGVDWHKRDQKWRARIKISGGRIELGYFDDIKFAVIAYNQAAQKYFGEFANQN